MAFLENIKSVEAFKSLPRGYRNLVFYSEGPEYWPHMRAIVEEVLCRHRYPLVYLASHPEDPGLQLQTPLVNAFCIGSGGERAELFRTLEADVMVLTMPDLDTLSLKRSPRCRHYAYIFHSPVSTHMIYQASAFDHFDSVFCVGPHHEEEIRQREVQTGSAPKRLVRCGYGRLDEILRGTPKQVAPVAEHPYQVVIAPSWGPNGIFEMMGAELVETLLEAGLHVIARPHPQTVKLHSEKIQELIDFFGNHDRFILERSVVGLGSLLQSHLMISDWSGVALDYAFGLLKPVLFINTPRKVNNPNYEQLGIEPLEVFIRDRIGHVVEPGELERLPDVVEEMIQIGASWRDAILFERNSWIFNLGQSSSVAASELTRLASNLNATGDSGGAEIDCAGSTKAVINRLAARLLQDEVKEGRGAVQSFLIELLNTSGPLSLDQIERLECLCRRVDVFKRVCTTYNSDFSKVIDRTPVNRDVLAVLVYVLIMASLKISRSDMGRSLKFLNGAGNTLNLYLAAGGTIAVPQLESFFYQTWDSLEISL